MLHTVFVFGMVRVVDGSIGSPEVSHEFQRSDTSVTSVLMFQLTDVFVVNRVQDEVAQCGDGCEVLQVGLFVELIGFDGLKGV